MCIRDRYGCTHLPVWNDFEFISGNCSVLKTNNWNGCFFEDKQKWHSMCLHTWIQFDTSDWDHSLFYLMSYQVYCYIPKVKFVKNLVYGLKFFQSGRHWISLISYYSILMFSSQRTSVGVIDQLRELQSDALASWDHSFFYTICCGLCMDKKLNWDIGEILGYILMCLLILVFVNQLSYKHTLLRLSLIHI